MTKDMPFPSPRHLPIALLALGLFAGFAGVFFMPRATAQEPDADAPKPEYPFLLTAANDDEFLVRPIIPFLVIETSIGELKIPGDQFLALENKGGTSKVTFGDESILVGTLTTNTLSFVTEVGGPLRLPIEKIRSVAAAPKLDLSSAFPHIVRDDETVEALIRGYLVTFEHLKRYSPDLKRGKLKLGSVILIPPFD